MKRFITLNEELYFDNVSSARTLKGLIMNFNAQAKNYVYSHYADFDLNAKRINLLIGCEQKHLDSIIDSTTKENEIELGIGGNFLDSLYPRD